jgi:hypothetical protein
VLAAEAELVVEQLLVRQEVAENLAEVVVPEQLVLLEQVAEAAPGAEQAAEVALGAEQAAEAALGVEQTVHV